MLENYEAISALTYSHGFSRGSMSSSHRSKTESMKNLVFLFLEHVANNKIRFWIPQNPLRFL